MLRRQFTPFALLFLDVSSLGLNNSNDARSHLVRFANHAVAAVQLRELEIESEH